LGGKRGRKKGLRRKEACKVGKGTKESPASCNGRGEKCQSKMWGVLGETHSGGKKKLRKGASAGSEVLRSELRKEKRLNFQDVVLL